MKKMSSFEEYVSAYFWDLDKKISFKDDHYDHIGFSGFPLREESEVSKLFIKRYFEKVFKDEH